MRLKFLPFLFFLLFTLSFASAQNESTINWSDPVLYIKLTIGLVAILTIFLFLSKKWSSKHKKFLFFLLAIPVLGSTIYLGAHTIFENVTSVTNGPVHWHFDYQVWACGERLDLINPKFPGNKIGTPLLHEHNDDRAHIEGVIMNLDDIKLGKFFEVIGGELTSTHLIYDAINGKADYTNGMACPDGSIGTLKVYANGKKIDDPYTYMYAKETIVPPGDCIIVDFSSENSPTTSKLCESWDVKGWTYENQAEKRAN